MADVVALANDVSTPIAVAWILWLAWSIVQVGWYRRACIAVPVTQLAPDSRLERRRVVLPRRRSHSVSIPKPSAPGDITAAPYDVPRPLASTISGSEARSGQVAGEETPLQMGGAHRD